MQLDTIPRTYVRVLLRTARLPISTAERVTGHDGDRAWPPVLAFDAFAANVEQVFGSMLGDDELVRHGRREQARVAELRDAVRLETLAEQAGRDATQMFQERRKADERKRQAATKRSRKREESAEREQRQAEAALDAKADARRAKARKATNDRKATLAKKQRTTKQASVAKERQAVAKAKAAANAKSRALEADKRIRATKARRSA
jgi:hypothetical protein